MEVFSYRMEVTNVKSGSGRVEFLLKTSIAGLMEWLKW
jgi:hypothetical protein